MTPMSDSPLSASCTASAASRNPKTFSVTSIRLASSLLPIWTAERNTTTSSRSTTTSTPTATASTARLAASADRVTAAVAVPRAEHHGDRDDHQDDAAGDAQRAGREVEQPGEQAAEDQQERGDRGGGGQHLAQDAALGGLRHAGGHVEERHQCDLGPHADQQRQERVDDEGDVQRFELQHPGEL